MINPSFFFLLLGVWYPSGVSYDYAPIIYPEDIEETCGSNHDACLHDINGHLGIALSYPYGFEPLGCNNLTHEYYHLLGYRENEIPRCMLYSMYQVNQIETVDRDYDGIPDSSDDCPDIREYYNRYQDDDGCPDMAPATIFKTLRLS